jgi:hypothetical protein
MGLLTRLVSARLEWTPRHAVGVRRDLRVPMADGVELLADLHAPRGLVRGPTLLIRSPYGRRPFGLSMAAPFAAQGYFALVQSCRGTAGSGGVFDPHHHERADGLATLDWLERQPWFDGAIFSYGPSYLGYTQWAIAAEAGPELRAMAMQITLSDFSQMTYAGGSFMLENALSWTQLVSQLKRTLGKLKLAGQMLLGLPAIADRQWRSLPLVELDRVVTGEQVPFWRDWMEHGSAQDPWWRSMDCSGAIPQIRRPVTLISGWHDIFAPWSLRDFQALQRAGVPARISIGPWHHTDRRAAAFAMRDALDWFAQHAPGGRAEPGDPVKLFVQGADEWRGFDTWPPRESRTATWFLQPDSRLAQQLPADSPPERYRYDPADPTPSLGGPSLSERPFCVDNRPLESRRDVLCFSSPPLADDLDVIGVPEAGLHVSSSAPSADFFVRLCDVDPAGVSRNVCDGLQRVAIRADRAPQPLRVELWPTAWRFRRGHRLRVQVSSGAFPRWARNPGSGEPLATATALHAAEQSIHHSPAHPSALVLPLCPAGAGRLLR